MSTPSAARSQVGGGPAAARAAEATSPADPRRWWILAVIGIAQLMLVLDSTIVNIALPSAQRALHFADSDRVWIVTAYALAFGSFLLLGGRLGDMFGRKRTFIAGLAGFALASAAGGAAPDFAVLVSARAVQGLFAALLAPSTLTLLATTFTDAKERGRAFAVYGAVAGGGGSVGLLLGGALTSYGSWRWCLYVNLIFAAVAAAGGLLLLSNQPRQSRPVIDVPGVVLASAGLFALVFGFSRAQTDSWGSSVTLAWLAAGVALLAGFVLVQRRVEHPLLPLRVVLDRNRAGAYAAIGLTFIAVFALFFFLTFYLQGVRGYSPVKTGLAFLPLPLALVVSSGISTVRLFPRLGPRHGAAQPARDRFQLRRPRAPRPGHHRARLRRRRPARAQHRHPGRGVPRRRRRLGTRQHHAAGRWFDRHFPSDCYRRPGRRALPRVPPGAERRRGRAGHHSRL
jgi:MFS family permease